MSGTILGGERNREINGWIAIAMAMRDERRKTLDMNVNLEFLHLYVIINLGVTNALLLTAFFLSLSLIHWLSSIDFQVSDRESIIIDTKSV